MTIYFFGHKIDINILQYVPSFASVSAGVITFQSAILKVDFFDLFFFGFVLKMIVVFISGFVSWLGGKIATEMWKSWYPQFEKKIKSKFKNKK